MSVRSAVIIFCLISVSLVGVAPAQTTPNTQSKAVGEIKSISNGGLVLNTDDGGSLHVAVSENAKVVRIPPGATDLKSAIPITPQDLQPGDRVLVRGVSSEDKKSLQASVVIVMKQSDVAAKQQHEREDWIKRGIGGLVSEVGPTPGTVTITVSTFGSSKKVVVATDKKTIVRRYSTDSIRFDDAKPAKLSDIHVGDQLRARGTKVDDGAEFKAEEIVSGTFRNIAGTVNSVNPGDETLVVMDVFTKKPITVRISADSQLRKLPQPLAQRIAMRMKGQSPESAQGGPPSAGTGDAGAGTAHSANPAGQAGTGGRSGDLQQLLSRSPAVALSELQKGDAVILVSTEGNAAGVTAITLVAGVEPILTAAPSGQAMTLSPWSLSGGQGESQ